MIKDNKIKSCESIPNEKINVVLDEERFVQLDVDVNKRLIKAIDVLRKRGNIHLFLGLGIAMFATTVLIYSVWRLPDFETVDHRLFLFCISRGFIFVYVKTFSFFFLNLYKSDREGIMFFQNELTNIEMRTLAIKRAKPGSKAAGKIAEELSKTDRNFFTLKKGESTVGLERSRMEEEGYKDFLNIMLGAIKTKIKKS